MDEKTFSYASKLDAILDLLEEARKEEDWDKVKIVYNSLSILQGAIVKGVFK